jgi:aryl-alcohol dehydrogenase-like predicted oxidoreductase
MSHKARPRISRRQTIKLAAVAVAASTVPGVGGSLRAADTGRRLGRGGPLVSPVGLGCNNFGGRLDQAGTEQVVHAAVDNGITLFDTADVYSRGLSEEYLGRALGARRSKVLIATKFGGAMGAGPAPDGGGTRANIMYAAEASLKRLNTDVIDLYQYHRPDNVTPMEETLRAMDDLVQQGKVRYIGHSNFNAAQAYECEKISADNGLARYISAQNHYSLLTRGIEDELAPACEELGLGILPYFPLESGALTGKYKRNEEFPEGTRMATFAARSPQLAERFLNDERFTKIEKLTELAASADATLLDFAFGWLLNKPYIGSVIAGASRPAHIESNVKAAEWRPTPDLDREIDRITRAA